MAAMSKSKKDLILKLSIFVILICVVASVTFYLGSIVDDLEKKESWLKNDIGDMGRKLEGMNKKTMEFSEGVKVWESISESDKSLTGLRINDAKDVLDKLQAKYKLSSVKTSFSKPDNIEGDYKTDTVGMVSSTISMNFSAISDEYIYNFILDMTKNFPGFVQIKSISINKPIEVNKETLKRIAAGEEVGIISVALEFYWHDLKYKGPTATPGTPEGGGPAK